MPRSFTQYWRNDTWESNRFWGHSGTVLEHTADNNFRTKGITPGDHVYIVTIKSGKLFLLCRGTVAEITDARKAARRLGEDADDLWVAKDHLLLKPSDAARQDYDRQVPDSLVRKIKMLRATGSQPLRYIAAGKLDQQTLRGVCELTGEAAALLDRVIGIGHGGQRETRANRTDGSGQAKRTIGPAAELAPPSSDLQLEKHFEQEHVLPMVMRWGFEVKEKHQHRFKLGSKHQTLIIDVLLADEQGEVTIIESKRTISTEQQHKEALDQACSYSRQLNTSSCILVAPEGLWIYRLWQGQPHLVEKLSLDAARKKRDWIKAKLLDIRASGNAPPPPLAGHRMHRLGL